MDNDMNERQWIMIVCNEKNKKDIYFKGAVKTHFQFSFEITRGFEWTVDIGEVQSFSSSTRPY